MATLSSLLQILGLFCRISSLLLGSFAKETFNFKEPTDRNHPITNIIDPLTISTVDHSWYYVDDCMTMLTTDCKATGSNEKIDDTRVGLLNR